jgi:hypothetical protein
MLARYTLAVLLFALTGCGGNPQPQVALVRDTSSTHQKASANEGNPYEVSRLFLDADGILVVFDSLEEFTSDWMHKTSDSIIYPLEVGESPSIFSIRSASYRVIDVSQSFRTTMTVGAEGPHCELENWIHYESPWTKLSLRDRSGSIRVRSFEPADGSYERFPKHTGSELYAQVERHCGKEWADGLRRSDSIAKTKDSLNFEIDRGGFYSGPGISDYTYRIIGVHLSTGDTVTKYIRLKFAMGC